MALLQAEIDTQRQIIKVLRNELPDMKKDRTLGAAGLTGFVDQLRLTSQPPRAPDRLRHLSSNVEYISGGIDSIIGTEDASRPFAKRPRAAALLPAGSASSTGPTARLAAHIVGVGPATRWLPSHAVSSLVLHTRSAGRCLLLAGGRGADFTLPGGARRGLVGLRICARCCERENAGGGHSNFLHERRLPLVSKSSDNDIKDGGVPIDIATRPIVTSAWVTEKALARPCLKRAEASPWSSRPLCGARGNPAPGRTFLKMGK
ncbi:hypothetical protein ABIF63_003550 [Bradyrhizobium japonicum]|uniref:Transposase n=1 Tax=Bradyrhizobium japonicum TaxID=375 RepID=A0ABV2RRA6_BRAJP|nr:hypothetical protein [Bradyrhizobium japonicum]WLB17319.1 hypothetical protein QIH95_35755 [Bradyrhizobium japonicum]